MRRVVRGVVEGADLRSAGGAVVGVPLVLILVLFAAADAGFSPDVWLPAAALVLGLVALVLTLPQIVRGIPRATAIASVSIFAFAGWCFVSIAWADARADAWNGANRTFFYATLYTGIAVWPWRSRTVAIVLGAFALGVAAVGVATGVAALRTDDPSGYFIDALLSEPAGYHNANSALFLLAFWPALFLASRSETLSVLRPLLLGAACVLLELAFLSQSRGSLYTFPLSVVVYFAIVAGRLRSLVALAPVAAVALLAHDRLLDVYRDVGADRAHDGVRNAAITVSVSFAAAFAAGVALTLVDRRFPMSGRAHAAASRFALVVLAAVLAVGALAVARSDPIDRASDSWRDFKRYHSEQDGGVHFTSGLGSNRYDFWRVSLGEFLDAPLHGIGVDNFAIPYVRERRSDEEPLYPHSLGFGVLSQTGIVGAALLASFAAAALAAAWRGRRLRDPLAAATAALGITAGSYFALHAGGDWLWELPGIACPALAALALAAGLARGDPVAAPRRLPRGAGAATGLFAVLALLSYAFPWLAAQETQAGAAAWRIDPERAYARLDRASALNPLTDEPQLVAGAIASRLRDWSRMRGEFQRALDRNPHSWYANLELGLAYALEGRRTAALVSLDRARALNPREPTIAIARMQIRAGKTPSPQMIDRLLLERVERRLGK